jgi:hypothetical protein
VVRLRNQWVPIDPRSWNSDMDVEVDIALGAGTEEQKIAVLNSIAQKQEQIMQTMGPQNPLVSPQQYRNTLVKLAEASGYRNSDEFFSNPATMPPQPPPPPPPPDPAQILAEVEKQKIMADIQNKQAELELKRQAMLLEDDRARDKQEADIMLRAYEVQLKYGTSVDTETLRAMMERPRTASPSVQRPVIPEITPFDMSQQAPPPPAPQQPMAGEQMPPVM